MRCQPILTRTIYLSWQYITNNKALTSVKTPWRHCRGRWAWNNHNDITLTR